MGARFASRDGDGEAASGTAEVYPFNARRVTAAGTWRRDRYAPRGAGPPMQAAYARTAIAALAEDRSKPYQLSQRRTLIGSMRAARRAGSWFRSCQ